MENILTNLNIYINITYTMYHVYKENIVIYFVQIRILKSQIPMNLFASSTDFFRSMRKLSA